MKLQRSTVWLLTVLCTLSGMAAWYGQSPGPALIPSAGPARWIALRMQALADGIMELAVATTLEGRRPATERSPAMVQRWQSQIADALAVAATEVEAHADRVTVGHVAIGAALGYLDFRHHATSWRADQPALSSWFAAFSERADAQHAARRLLLPSLIKRAVAPVPSA